MGPGPKGGEFELDWSLSQAMGWQSDQSAWAVARRQHGVVTRSQLREIGLSDPGIDHRLKTGDFTRCGGACSPWGVRSWACTAIGWLRRSAADPAPC